MPLRLHPLQSAYGTHSLLGQRQSVLVAYPFGAGTQRAVLRVAAAALRQARTSVAADVEDEPARPLTGIEGWRLRGVRIGRHFVLPRFEVPAAADLRAEPRGSRRHHARHLRIPSLRRTLGVDDRERDLRRSG